MDDAAVFEHINALSSEEETLYASAGDGGLSTDESERLKVIQVELDRCYDLLHQRQAQALRRAGPRGRDAAGRSRSWSATSSSRSAQAARGRAGRSGRRGRRR